MVITILLKQYEISMTVLSICILLYWSRICCHTNYYSFGIRESNHKVKEVLCPGVVKHVGLLFTSLLNRFVLISFLYECICNK